MDDGNYPVTSLIDAAAAGDEHAWHEIVDRYTPMLGSVIRRFRLTAAETQDVAQTVWLRLVEHLSGLREPRALSMWIITMGKQEIPALPVRPEAVRALRSTRSVPAALPGRGSRTRGGTATARPA